MGSPLTDATLDAILAMQVTVAWAGEGRCSPRRLGWWDTDLVDKKPLEYEPEPDDDKGYAVASVEF
jgi:hypothetical protein